MFFEVCNFSGVPEGECVTPFFCGGLVVDVHGSPLGVAFISVCNVFKVIGGECVTIRVVVFVEITGDKEFTSGACVVDNGVTFDAFTYPVVAVTAEEDVMSEICIVVVTVTLRAFEVVEIRTGDDSSSGICVVIVVTMVTVVGGDTPRACVFEVVTLGTSFDGKSKLELQKVLDILIAWSAVA